MLKVSRETICVVHPYIYNLNQFYKFKFDTTTILRLYHSPFLDMLPHVIRFCYLITCYQIFIIRSLTIYINTSKLIVMDIRRHIKSFKLHNM